VNNAFANFLLCVLFQSNVWLTIEQGKISAPEENDSFELDAAD
jgi:hypothetical protein